MQRTDLCSCGGDLDISQVDLILFLQCIQLSSNQ